MSTRSRQVAEFVREHKLPGEAWKFLRGFLYDPAGRGSCPDAISEFVADHYVITSFGRLFKFWPGGAISEMSVRASGQARIYVGGVEWQPTVERLVHRAFPETAPRQPKARPRSVNVVSLDAVASDDPTGRYW